MSNRLPSSRVELLAPVGKWNVLEAVIAAGADAVYLGGKKYNMRLHSKDFNFTDEELRSVVSYAHERSVKVYVTVNNLLTNAEIDDLGEYLQFLEEIATDGIIAQDLGVVQLAHDLNLGVPLHASVMMNAHNLEGLQLLKDLGIRRVILAREVTLADIKLWHSQTDLELEYFAHGDMCFSQSSQCYLCGMLFGESSNRGRCLKPCRWPFELIDRETGSVLAPGGAETPPGQCPGKAGPYFLAVKDICLLPFLPEVIDAGVCSLKIEGRMREAGFLGSLIGFYRRALDRYYADPCGYQFDWDEYRNLEQMRVRDLSPLYAFGNPGPMSVGYTGEREPHLFSNAVREHEITKGDLQVNPLPEQRSEARSQKSEKDLKSAIEGMQVFHPTCVPACFQPEAKPQSRPSGIQRPLLAVKAGSLAAALAALEHGADLIYAGGESFISQGRPWRPGDFAELLAAAHSRTSLVSAGPSVPSGPGAAPASGGAGSAPCPPCPEGTEPTKFATLTIKVALDPAPPPPHPGLPPGLKECGAQVGAARVVIGTPRIAMSSEMGRVNLLLSDLLELQPQPDGIMVTNLGTIFAAGATGLPLYADYSCNIANSRATALLQSYGAVQATAPLEFRAEEILSLPARSPLALEAVVHGQLPGMVSDHCLPAALLDGATRFQICSGSCRQRRFGLRDAAGMVHPLEIDTSCRNHLFMAHELALLPYLRSFYGAGFRSLRLEIPCYTAAEAGAVTALYRANIDRLWRDPEAYEFATADWEQLLQARKATFGAGPYLRGVQVKD